MRFFSTAPNQSLGRMPCASGQRMRREQRRLPADELFASQPAERGPLLALVVAVGVAAAGLGAGRLDAIAPVITMFF